MKLTIPSELGNAPKNRLIIELSTLLARYEVDRALAYLTDDFCWTLVGDSPVEGKENFANTLREMSGNKATELNIISIVSHGREGAVHGEVTMENGSVYGFADFYVFSNASVRAITSYVIQKKEPNGSGDC